jgi:cytidine deaminase
MRFFESLLNYLDQMVSKRLSKNHLGQPCLSKFNNTLHSAMIFKKSGNQILPLSYGENWIYNTTRYNPGHLDLSAHAEHAAVMNLRPNENRKKRAANIFVIKLKLSGLIGPSEPCSHCLGILAKQAAKKGYSIKNVYFTNREKNIEMRHLNDLLKNPYVTRLVASPWRQ